MEHIKLIADFIMAIAWPAAILIIFFSLKSDIVSLLRQTHSRLSSGKGVRAKFGSIELDFDTKRELEEVAEELKDEDDPKERLRRAKAKVKRESVLTELRDADIEGLQQACEWRHPEAILVDWHNISKDEASKIRELRKKGLIASYGLYDDEMHFFTDVGAEVAKTLGIHANP